MRSRAKPGNQKCGAAIAWILSHPALHPKAFICKAPSPWTDRERELEGRPSGANLFVRPFVARTHGRLGFEAIVVARDVRDSSSRAQSQKPEFGESGGNAGAGARSIVGARGNQVRVAFAVPSLPTV